MHVATFNFKRPGFVFKQFNLLIFLLIKDINHLQTADFLTHIKQIKQKLPFM